MNERTKQLAEQADRISLQADLYARSDNSSMLFENWKNRYTERLIELTVRECAYIAGKAEYSDTWIEPVEDAIKQHFGVE
jgi:hypothetical protein